MVPEKFGGDIFSFQNTDGAFPYATLVEGVDGNLYGAATYGGKLSSCQYGCGTLFEILPSGKLTVLYSFDGTDGQSAYGGLIQATDGSLYGTTRDGGANGDYGTIFKITTAGELTVLHSFDGTDGGVVLGGLVQGTNGSFYGATNEGGGPESYGTVYNLATGLGPFVAFVRNSGRVGQTGGILGQGLTGTTAVTLNGNPVSFTVVTDTFIKATVPSGATTGYVTVATPNGMLQSNVPFRVIP